MKLTVALIVICAVMIGCQPPPRHSFNSVQQTLWQDCDEIEYGDLRAAVVDIIGGKSGPVWSSILAIGRSKAVLIEYEWDTGDVYRKTIVAITPDEAAYWSAPANTNSKDVSHRPLIIHEYFPESSFRYNMKIPRVLSQIDHKISAQRNYNILLQCKEFQDIRYKHKKIIHSKGITATDFAKFEVTSDEEPEKYLFFVDGFFEHVYDYEPEKPGPDIQPRCTMVQALSPEQQAFLEFNIGPYVEVERTLNIGDEFFPFGK